MTCGFRVTFLNFRSNNEMENPPLGYGLEFVLKADGRLLIVKVDLCTTFFRAMIG